MADDPNTCGICWMPMGILHGRTDTLCSGPGWHHSFHAACVNQWIGAQVTNGAEAFTCPTCRREIPEETLRGLPLDRWPTILVTLNGVNAVAFVLSREIIRLHALMRTVSRAVIERWEEMPREVWREEFMPVFRSVLRLEADLNNPYVILFNVYLLLSSLFTAYAIYRLLTPRRRINRQQGGTQPTTLCFTINDKENCVEIPEEMVGFITDILMRIKDTLPEVEAGLKKTDKSNTRKKARNRKRNPIGNSLGNRKRNMIGNRTRSGLAY